MDWQDRMNRAIAWIELHLTEEMEWEEAAREANCSLFHFLRMFEVIAGITAGDYVRRRRLSLAAMELASGDAKIIDVALRYGYDSPDAFAKAFRKLFGCTPTGARRPGARLRSYPPITFSITLKGGQAMEYRIETKPAFHLTGVPLRTTTKEGQCFREIPALWDRCMNDGSFAKLRALVSQGSTIGVAGVSAEFDMKNGEFTYLIAVETPADRSALPANSRDIPVPAATWGVFESRGPIPEAIQGVMQRIFNEWFPSSGWEHADGPELEIYSAGDIRDPDYYSEIWIPLQKPSN
jgi:AraC family transcriptional regulator